LLAFLLLLIMPLFFILHPIIEKEYLYLKESQYNIIKVKDSNNNLFIYLNNFFAYFSKSLNKNMLSESYYDYFLLGPMITGGKDILILGNGAGTAMISLSNFFNVNIDGIEIDRELTNVGIIFFNLKTDNKVKIIHEDARTYLYKSNKQYDVVIVDLYNGSTYVPFHLATVEFFKLVSRNLKNNGTMIVNIPFYAMGTKLEEYYINSIQQEFRNNYIIDHIFFGFKNGITKNEIIEKISRFDRNEKLKEIISNAESMIKEYKFFHSKFYFTDDKSQIEKLTFSIIKR